MKNSSSFVIKGRLDGLNEYTKCNRSNKYLGSKIKKNNEKVVILAIKQANLKKICKYPVEIIINWYEPNNRRDIDNVTFAIKFILDSLVKTGILIDDSRKYVIKVTHEVMTDKENPRIVVTLKEY